MSAGYEPEQVARYFDQYGIAEWHRMTATPVAEVSLHIHRHYLMQHIAPGMRVLEIGAGAGRFTQVLAELGARVLVGDLSQEQLRLNREHAALRLRHRCRGLAPDRHLRHVCPGDRRL